jgi:hypothetical protein
MTPTEPGFSERPSRSVHRYDVHHDPDAERRCDQAMRELRLAGDENELRRRASAGDRRAVITLFEILVDADRLDLLLGHGRLQEVRRDAESGDHTAARRLRGLRDS